MAQIQKFLSPESNILNFIIIYVITAFLFDVGLNVCNDVSHKQTVRLTYLRLTLILARHNLLFLSIILLYVSIYSCLCVLFLPCF